MIILTSYGQEEPYDKVVKGKDFIQCFINNEMVRQDSRISDFSCYSLTDENNTYIEYSSPEIDEVTQLQLAVTELYEAVILNG